MMRLRFVHLFSCLMMLSTLVACGSDVWLGENNDLTLPGERRAVMPKSSMPLDEITVDVNKTCLPTLSGEDGQARLNDIFLTIQRPLKEKWRADIGEGTSKKTRLQALPVVADNRVYTIDTEANVSSFDMRNGNLIWRQNVAQEDEDEALISGLLNEKDGVLIVATGHAEVMAMEAATGKIIWRQKTQGPVRAMPAVSENRVYVLSIDNQMEVFELFTGVPMWQHQGNQEVSGTLGTTRVTATNEVVIVPYSSGELYALKPENGRVLWGENLSSSRRLATGLGLTDIIAWPVIAGPDLYAISLAGRMASINVRTGRRQWDVKVGGSQTPDVTDEHLYMITNTNHVLCLSRKNGQIFWLQQLDKEAENKDDDEPLQFYGPALAGDRMIVVSARGEVLSISPFDGRVQGSIQLPEEVKLAPIVSERTLLILGNDGTLFAFN